MMITKKSSVLTFAEKCKSILASNWQGNLYTIKADAVGSKEEIHTSKVKYFLNKGKPYIWVPEGEQHNVNAIIDERGSFTVSSASPGPLMHLLKALKKPPARVALVGDIAHIKDERAKAAGESLRESISKEAVTEASYSVSQMLISSVARSRDLNVILHGIENYCVYKVNPRSCMYIDRTGSIHEVQLENFLKAKADPLSLYSLSVIDGINRSETRRRALALFCITFLNLNAKDAFIVSLDRKGFDVLGKVSSDGSGEYQWKELRFTFSEETNGIECFCQKLIEMEDEAVKSLQRCTGIH